MIKLAKYSLAFLWISTGVISAVISPEIGFDILAKVDIFGSFANLFVYGGSLVDIVIGIWILSNNAPKLCCQVQIAIILVYSLLLTYIAPSFWIHPFGPLTKNIPILVLIMIILNSSKKS